eukprot:TRINITY_DN36571_c0_g1_i1.p1 TRINITY_DN36571_c0_g1~~TRINITY_DN36571_c0_g1_i1.p1  ORF type:complete len:389 (+),score=57.43 TRINITY_DN36571_c0_g1_i1:82-1248(+)
MIRAALLVGLLSISYGRRQKLSDDMRLDYDLHKNGWGGSCPCANESLCQPVQVHHEKEVFGFNAQHINTTDWVHLDMDQVTTVAWRYDAQMMCVLHQHNIRVIAGAPGMNLTLLGTNSTAMTEYVANVIEMVKNLYIDGVTFDYESPMAADAPEREYYVQVVANTTAALHKAVSGSQTSVCVAWSPFGIDGRWYDIKGLADASDLLYMMVYDTRSQVFEQCVAAPNAALPLAENGIQKYLSLGISPKKLILGLPWYGFDYPCLPGTKPDDDVCFIPFSPFRGVQCSDAAGRGLGFRLIMPMLPNSTTGRRFSPDLSTAYFNYVDANGTVHQLWYDDADTLKAKYELCNKYNLRGTGPFTYADLDYSTPESTAQAQTMWDALKVFTEAP